MPETKQTFINRQIEWLTSLSYSTLFTLWIAQAALFGLAYFLLALFAPAHGPTQLAAEPGVLVTLLDSAYFSIITATSTGYGDITPLGASKILASLQSIVALMVFATFVTKLVSHKQELALREVHKLTFEDVFHNTREGLYLARKDCDRLVKHLETNNALDEEHWKNMVIVFRQTKTLLQEIPQFYADDESQTGLYTIDRDREALLHEAVHRTLHRINQMLDSLSEHRISWEDNPEAANQLGLLVKSVDVVVPIWQEESPYTEVFEDILHLNQSIHKRIQESTSA